MFGSLFFLIREAWLNLRRQGLMAVACVSTSAIALLILGVFFLIGTQLYRVVDGAPRQMEIHAFMREGATRAQATALQERLEDMPGVAVARLVTREQAWTEFRQKSSFKDVLDGFKENPLPDMLRIVTTTPEETLRLADWVRSLPEVDHVNEGKEVVRQLLTIYNVIRTAGVVLAVLLGLGTAAIISNAIRMTLFARRRDIRVMQLVGATNSFIRFPFLLEGMAEGALGGGIASGLLLAALHYYTTRVQPTVPVVNQFELDLNRLLFVGILVGGGAVLGMVGSLLSMRKFLHAT